MDPAPAEPNVTMGLDIGLTNLGVGTFDGVRLRIGRMNLTVEEINGLAMQVNLTAARFIDVACRFVDSNEALWPRVRQVLLETQMKSKMEQMAQALGGVIKGRYPHIKIRHTNPKLTRGYFNTKVIDKTMKQQQKYRIRKALSKETLTKIFGPAECNRLEQTLGAKTDDAIEAGLLAIYGHAVPERAEKLQGRATNIRPVLSVAGRVIFREAGEVALTDSERRAVYDAPPPPRRAAKRTRADSGAAAGAAEAAPKRRKNLPAPPSP